MQSRRRAFTLIEILVSISVLGLLVAILLPSLGRARRSSRTVVCKTRLRELIAGWDMYASDSDGTMAPGRMFKQSGGTKNPANWYDVGNGLKYRPRWAATVGKYIGLFAFDKPSTTSDRQDYDHPSFVCPEVSDWVDERNAAYGYNHQFLGNSRRGNGRFYNFPVKRSRIRATSGTVVAGDCMGTAAGLAKFDRLPYVNDGPHGLDVSQRYSALGNHGWTLDPPRLSAESDHGTGDFDSPRTAVDPRHVDRANVVFADGHTETLTPVALGYRMHEDGRFVDLDPFEDVVHGPPHNGMFSGSGKDLLPPERP